MDALEVVDARDVAADQLGMARNQAMVADVHTPGVAVVHDVDRTANLGVLGDIRADQGDAAVAHEVLDVGGASGQEAVEADDVEVVVRAAATNHDARGLPHDYEVEGERPDRKTLISCGSSSERESSGTRT